MQDKTFSLWSSHEILDIEKLFLLRDVSCDSRVAYATDVKSMTLYICRAPEPFN